MLWLVCFMWRTGFPPPTPEVAFRGVLHHICRLEVGESNDGRRKESSTLTTSFSKISERTIPEWTRE